MERRIGVASAFDTPGDQERGVMALLIDSRTRIEEWREHGKKDRLVLTIGRPDDVHVRAFQRIAGIGPSFNKLEEDDFPVIKGVFQKDDVSMENPWGLVTCFPSQD